MAINGTHTCSRIALICATIKRWWSGSQTLQKNGFVRKEIYDVHGITLPYKQAWTGKEWNRSYVLVAWSSRGVNPP